MANQHENNNENETRSMIPVGIRLTPDLHAAVQQVRIKDERPSTANTVERLLRTHPRLRKIIEDAAAVA